MRTSIYNTQDRIGFRIGSSETIRAACSFFLRSFSTMNTKYSRKNIRYKIHFSYWLAGLIDGDGWLGVSTKGYTCCEITVGINELSILSVVKKHLGGSITLRKNISAYRWRLHNKAGMERLVDLINGKLMLPKRHEQFENVCNSLNKVSNPQGVFSIRNYWASGFFDAEGYFHVNKKTLQCSITCSQKTPKVLEDLVSSFGGHVYYDTSWNGYLYTASSKQDLETWFDYFSQYPLKSPKAINLVRFKRLCLFKQRKDHINPLRKPQFLKLLKTFYQRKSQ
jgi:hypothetical protein